MTFSVKVTGIDRIARKLGPAGVGHALTGALRDAGSIVQHDAQTTVHSPDNPFIGKAKRDISTGRLQAAIGQSDIRGSGLNQSIAVGTPYGKTGAGTFSRSSSRTRSGRTGGRRNKANPNVYGPIEERRHPFLGPALRKNVGRIRSLIQHAIAGVLRA